ncbi:hypothetical protein QYE76_061293 [Lolium multiflorum]|uniref:CCHC-type domain-containing protein n=1 Tax=Lolium multiflorum TaxID=4521 RepID=A0AAD8W535_LOLMU|nr:hypothetical protein QYE76_061293 [Lolium multiflorum]
MGLCGVLSVGPAQRSPGRSCGGGPDLVSRPVGLAGGELVVVGLEGEAQQSSGPGGVLEVGVTEPVRPSTGVRRPAFRWLWLPKGCANPALGFPARFGEVRKRLGDPYAPPHRLLRKIAEAPPLLRSFAEAVSMERGGDDGRKRRFDSSNGRRPIGGVRGAGGRQDGGAGRQMGGEGGRSDGGGNRFDGGSRGESFRAQEEGGGRQEERYRYMEAGGSRQAGGSRGQGEDLRYHNRGGEQWGQPPPWWSEQDRREEEESRLWEQQQGGASAWGQGDRPGLSGPGDQGISQGRHQSATRAKNKKVAGPDQAQQKGKNKTSAAKTGAPIGGECFKCGRQGHFQSECSFQPLCVICSSEGHASADCPAKRNILRLQSMGHAITGGGFFNIDVEPLSRKGDTGEVFAAAIKFASTPLSGEQLTEELKLMVDENWDWQVTRVSESEFTVVFPSRETRRMCTVSGKLYLPVSQLETTIREAFLAPRPSLVLPSAWVKLTGVPEDLLTKERVQAAFVMLGRIIDVDELSLLKWDREPIRARVQCRYPERIKGSIQVFVNGEGYTVGLQVEPQPRGSGGGAGGGPPPPPPPRNEDEDEESDDASSEGEWKHGRRKKDKNEQTKDMAKEPEHGKGQRSTKEVGEGSQRDSPAFLGPVEQ